MNTDERSIIDFLSEIEDPRRETANRRHELVDILVIALCGMLSAADDWVSIEQYGNAKRDWFARFLSLPNGIPSHDTFNRVFSRMDPEQFMNCFLKWVSTIRSVFDHELIAVDGKTLRRSHDGDNKAAIHMVSAWATQNNLVLGQVKTQEKSNEITAIPELLEVLSLKDSLVSIDAMGCQKAIADKIVAKGGDYLLAVKDNQSKLKAAIEETLCLRKRQVYVKPQIDFHEETQRNRDRKEVRRCWTTASLSKLDMAENWKGLNQIALVETERTIHGKTSLEKRYYICSTKLSAKETIQYSRNHWGVENKLHWVLDMAFREDECRVRKGYGAENLARLRHIALNLLKQDKTAKVGIKNKRLKAGWDLDYLLHLLNIDYQA
jgi:predicted transposase YbfD/YdcC